MAKDNKEASVPEASKDEQVGYHKGCLSTLTKERQELARILGIVEQLMQMHAAELKRLGVDLEGAEPEQPIVRQGKKPIEDIL
jgi:hypothetical protein